MFVTVNLIDENSFERRYATAAHLKRPLNKRNGNLTIGLVRLYCVIGYHSITPENAKYMREKYGNIPEGLYILSMFKNALREIQGADNINLKPLKHIGRVKVRVKRPYSITKHENSEGSVLYFDYHRYGSILS